MCDQTEVQYLPGEIVWVKLRALWWPGKVEDYDTLPEEITSSFRKRPIATVKFFHEDSYEYVHKLDVIYHYNCSKKHEFIKKGLDLSRKKTVDRPSNLDLFSKDVAKAEFLTGGDPKIIEDESFKPEEKPKYESLFGEKKKLGKKKGKDDSPFKDKAYRRLKFTSTPSTPGWLSRGSSPNIIRPPNNIPKVITHPRFLAKAQNPNGKSDYEVRILIQKTSDDDAKLSEKEYQCCLCGYRTCRLNVIILHFNTTHSFKIDSSTPRPKSSKSRSSRPSYSKLKGDNRKSDTSKSSSLHKKHHDAQVENESMDVSCASEEEASDSQVSKVKPPKVEVKQGKRGRKRKIQSDVDELEYDPKKPKVVDTLLLDWEEDTEQEQVELEKKREQERLRKEEETRIAAEVEAASAAATASKSKEVFEFDDDDDDAIDLDLTTNVKGFGRRIPRVIDSTKGRKQSILDSNKPVKSKAAMKEENDNIIEDVDSILAETSVPVLPSIPKSSTFSLDVDFDKGKSVEFDLNIEKPVEVSNSTETVKEDNSAGDEVVGKETDSVITESLTPVGDSEEKVEKQVQDSAEDLKNCVPEVNIDSATSNQDLDTASVVKEDTLQTADEETAIKIEEIKKPTDMPRKIEETSKPKDKSRKIEETSKLSKAMPSGHSTGGGDHNYVIGESTSRRRRRSLLPIDRNDDLDILSMPVVLSDDFGVEETSFVSKEPILQSLPGMQQASHSGRKKRGRPHKVTPLVSKTPETLKRSSRRSSRSLKSSSHEKRARSPVIKSVPKKTSVSKSSLPAVLQKSPVIIDSKSSVTYPRSPSSSSSAAGSKSPSISQPKSPLPCVGPKSPTSTGPKSPPPTGPKSLSPGPKSPPLSSPKSPLALGPKSPPPLGPKSPPSGPKSPPPLGPKSPPPSGPKSPPPSGPKSPTPLGPKSPPPSGLKSPPLMSTMSPPPVGPKTLSGSSKSPPPSGSKSPSMSSKSLSADPKSPIRSGPKSPSLVEPASPTSVSPKNSSGNLKVLKSPRTPPEVKSSAHVKSPKGSHVIQGSKTPSLVLKATPSSSPSKSLSANLTSPVTSSPGKVVCIPNTTAADIFTAPAISLSGSVSPPPLVLSSPSKASPSASPAPKTSSGAGSFKTIKVSMPSSRGASPMIMQKPGSQPRKLMILQGKGSPSSGTQRVIMQGMGSGKKILLLTKGSGNLVLSPQQQRMLTTGGIAASSQVTSQGTGSSTSKEVAIKVTASSTVTGGSSSPPALIKSEGKKTFKIIKSSVPAAQGSKGNVVLNTSSGQILVPVSSFPASSSAVLSSTAGGKFVLPVGAKIVKSKTGAGGKMVLQMQSSQSKVVLPSKAGSKAAQLKFVTQTIQSPAQSNPQTHTISPTAKPVKPKPGSPAKQSRAPSTPKSTKKLGFAAKSSPLLTMPSSDLTAASGSPAVSPKASNLVQAHTKGKQTGIIPNTNAKTGATQLQAKSPAGSKKPPPAAKLPTAEPSLGSVPDGGNVQVVSNIPVSLEQIQTNLLAASSSSDVNTSSLSTSTQQLVTVSTEDGGQLMYLIDNSALLSLDGTGQAADGSPRTLIIDPSSLGPSQGNLGNLILTFDNVGQPSASSSDFAFPTQSSGQDILAEALANTQVLQPDSSGNELSLDASGLISTHSGNALYQSNVPTLSHGVLETSLTLNQPIMTPLQDLSAVSSLQPPPVASTSLDLPITITQPDITISTSSYSSLPIPSATVQNTVFSEAQQVTSYSTNVPILATEADSDSGSAFIESAVTENEAFSTSDTTFETPSESASMPLLDTP